MHIHVYIHICVCAHIHIYAEIEREKERYRRLDYICVCQRAPKAMFWGLVMILVLIMFWALIAVEIINPVNHRLMLELEEPDPYCKVAFSSIPNASILFFQTLVAGLPIS